MAHSSGFTEGISVVTTTWNEAEHIEELLRRIKETLKAVKHEIIVIDDSSTDRTFELAKPLADVVLSKKREGQTQGFLFGAKLAKFPVIVTIDSDLENPPELIPKLLDKLNEIQLVVASRTVLPRISEKLASKTLGKIVGIHDFYSNFRVYKKETLKDVSLKHGETFGGELLMISKKRGFKIGEVMYEAPRRRSNPRIGGMWRANMRIMAASWKCILFYYFG